MAEYLFKSSSEAESTISKIADSLAGILNQRLSDLVLNKSAGSSINKSGEEQTIFEIDFNQWLETFDSMQSMAFLLGGLSKSASQESQALKNLVNSVQPLVFNLLKQEIYKTSSLTASIERDNAIEGQVKHESPIDGLLKLNKSILGYLQHVGGTKESQSYNESQVKELVTVILETYFLNKKPFILSFEKFKKNIKISKMIQNETNKEIIQNNANEIITFMNASGLQLENGKEIVKELLKAI